MVCFSARSLRRIQIACFALASFIAAGPALAVTETVLYSFQGGSDGDFPDAGLTNVGGTLYSTTAGGGSRGKGTVYKVTTDGTETVLYSFQGGRDGNIPNAGVIDAGGTLYGTTLAGGASGKGTVFKVTP